MFFISCWFASEHHWLENHKNWGIYDTGRSQLMPKAKKA